MNRSRSPAALCLILLAGILTGCSDSDDTVTPPGAAPLTPRVVALGITVALPAAIQFPIGVIEILQAFQPPAPSADLGAPPCTDLPLNICSTSGSAQYCTTGDPNTVDWVFTNCVDEDGISIDGTASVHTNGTTVTMVFPSNGFTIGGNAISGQLTINTLSAIQFVNLVTTVSGSMLTANGGPLTIVSEVANGTIQLGIEVSGFLPYQAATTVTNNSVVVVVTSDDTDYTCNGTLTFTDGDPSVTMTCVEGTPG